jgi:hypothetical protein
MDPSSPAVQLHFAAIAKPQEKLCAKLYRDSRLALYRLLNITQL